MQNIIITAMSYLKLCLFPMEETLPLYIYENWPKETCLFFEYSKVLDTIFQNTLLL